MQLDFGLPRWGAMATQHCYRVVLMLRRPSCQRIGLESVTVSGRCVENLSITFYPASVMVQMALPSLPAS